MTYADVTGFPIVGMNFAEESQHVTDEKNSFVERCFLSKTQAKKNRVRHSSHFLPCFEPGSSPELSTFRVQRSGRTLESRRLECRAWEASRTLHFSGAEIGKDPRVSTFGVQSLGSVPDSRLSGAEIGKDPESRRLECRVWEASQTLDFSGAEIGKEPRVSTFGVQSLGSIPDSRLFRCRDREGTQSLDVWSAESGKHPRLSTFQVQRSGRNPGSRRLECRVWEASQDSRLFRCRDREGTQSLDV